MVARATPATSLELVPGQDSGCGEYWPTWSHDFVAATGKAGADVRRPAVRVRRLAGLARVGEVAVPFRSHVFNRSNRMHVVAVKMKRGNATGKPRLIHNVTTRATVGCKVWLFLSGTTLSRELEVCSSQRSPASLAFAVHAVAETLRLRNDDARQGGRTFEVSHCRSRSRTAGYIHGVPTSLAAPALPGTEIRAVSSADRRGWSAIPAWAGPLSLSSRRHSLRPEFHRYLPGLRQLLLDVPTSG